MYAHAGYYGGMQRYDAGTGAVAWANATLPQQVDSVPAADATRIYFYLGPGGGSPGPAVGTLYAMNQATGAIDYTVANPANAANNVTLPGVALGSQGTALVAAANDAAGREVVCFDLGQGTVRWRAPVNYSGLFAADRGKVYVPAGGGLRILNEATGADLGTMVAPTDSPFGANVLLTDTLAFAASGTTTYAFDRDTLAVVWSAPVGGVLAWADHMLLVSNANGVSAFVAPVPEPGTLALLAAAAGGGWAVRRRRAVTPPPA